MSTEDRRKWIWAAALLTVAFGAVFIWLANPKNGNPFIQLALAVFPNFIAALVPGVLLYFWYRGNQRKRYIDAMRSVRGAVRELQLADKVAQDLMKQIVPAISELYFEKREPEPSDQDRTREKVKCRLCPNDPRQMKKGTGKCEHCGDLPGSFQSDEIE